MQSNTIINSELPNALKVYNFLSENHFDSRSICGMLGNFTRESHMDLLENEIGGGGGYGLAQWTPQETNYGYFPVCSFTAYILAYQIGARLPLTNS